MRRAGLGAAPRMLMDELKNGDVVLPAARGDGVARTIHCVA
jgi:hypothetical protein